MKHLFFGIFLLSIIVFANIPPADGINPNPLKYEYVSGVFTSHQCNVFLIASDYVQPEIPFPLVTEISNLGYINSSCKEGSSYKIPHRLKLSGIYETTITGESQKNMNLFLRRQQILET